MPKVSVIITTYNRASMLSRAIKSVLAQTLADFELLVLDNSSKDDTEKVVRSFADSRIRYIKHPAMGIAGARNLALREARAEYLAFLDDDDEFLPEKLALQYTVFENDQAGEIGLVYGAYEHIYQDTGKVYETIYPRHEGDVYAYAVSHRNTLTGSASNPLLSVSAVRAVGGYNEQVKTGEDYELFLRLARQYRFAAVATPLVRIYFHHGDRLSWRLEDYLQTELIVYREHEKFIQQHPAVQAHFLRVIGGKQLRLGLRREGRTSLVAALRLQPARLSIWGQFVLSFFPISLYRFFHRRAVALHHYAQRLSH